MIEIPNNIHSTVAELMKTITSFCGEISDIFATNNGFLGDSNGI